MEIKEFHGEQGRIFFREYGSGSPVMLLHGFGESGLIWEETVKAFQLQYRFIVPDLPGSGITPALADKAAAMETYASLIRELSTEVIDQQFVLLGHSMGGYVTLAFAEKSSEYLRGWGLIHSTAYADNEEKKSIRIKAIAFLLQNGSKAFLQTAIPGLFHDAQSNNPDIEFLIEQAAAFDPKVLAGYYEAMMARPNRKETLARSKVPVCMIAGRHDQAVPFSNSLEQAYLPPYCQFNILRNSAHMGMLEEPDVFRQHFGSFLASLAP